MDTLLPMCEFMTSERYVFDVIMRYSGAAAIAEIGPIATTFLRQVEVYAAWMPGFRKDVEPMLLAEGILAFVMQAAATHFCALHEQLTMRERLEPFLAIWLEQP